MFWICTGIRVIAQANRAMEEPTRLRSRSRPRHRQTETDFDSPMLHFPSRLPLSHNNPWKAWAKESFGSFPIVIKVNYFALTALSAIGLRFPESEGRGQYKRWHPDILRDLSDAECSSSFVCTMVMEAKDAFLRGPHGFVYMGKDMYNEPGVLILFCFNENVKHFGKVLSECPAVKTIKQSLNDYISDLSIAPESFRTCLFLRPTNLGPTQPKGCRNKAREQRVKFQDQRLIPDVPRPLRPPCDMGLAMTLANLEKSNVQGQMLGTWKANGTRKPSVLCGRKLHLLCITVSPVVCQKRLTKPNVFEKAWKEGQSKVVPPFLGHLGTTMLQVLLRCGKWCAKASTPPTKVSSWQPGLMRNFARRPSSWRTTRPPWRSWKGPRFAPVTCHWYLGGTVTAVWSLNWLWEWWLPNWHHQHRINTQIGSESSCSKSLCSHLQTQVMCCFGGGLDWQLGSTIRFVTNPLAPSWKEWPSLHCNSYFHVSFHIWSYFFPLESPIYQVAKTTLFFIRLEPTWTLDGFSGGVGVLSILWPRNRESADELCRQDSAEVDAGKPTHFFGWVPWWLEHTWNINLLYRFVSLFHRWCMDVSTTCSWCCDLCHTTRSSPKNHQFQKIQLYLQQESKSPFSITVVLFPPFCRPPRQDLMLRPAWKKLEAKLVSCAASNSWTPEFQDGR